MASERSSHRQTSRDGQVISTKGRRVVVRAGDEEVTCFLSGHRAVVGDRVRWVVVRGEGGKIVDVLPRARVLERRDFKGRDQVVAANLGGLLVVASADQPVYRPGLVDRYLVGAAHAGLDAAIVLTKTDLGLTDEVEADLAWREEIGIPVLRLSNVRSEGQEALLAFLVDRQAPGPWACVGHSGVGKTSVIQALAPEIDVGPIGEISTFWEQGRHTTTGSRIIDLGEGVQLADSPGIRTFLPSGLTPHDVRDHFPGLGPVPCRYRDCLHREGEEGCVADQQLEAHVLERYRRMLDEVVQLETRMRP